MMRYVFIIYIFILVINSKADAQAQDCQTSHKEFTKYTGDCKKGVANGQGIAEGENIKYEGSFKKGVVDGKGTLTIENKVFKGEFSKGDVYGYGSVYMNDSLIKEGYFKGNIDNPLFMGSEKSDLSGYKILQKDNLDQAQLRIAKNSNNSKAVTIRLNDPKNKSISNINVDERNNGQVAKSTITNSRSFVEINSVDFPFIMTLRYNVSNQSGNFNLPAILKINIKEPGDWVISITY